MSGPNKTIGDLDAIGQAAAQEARRHNDRLNHHGVTWSDMQRSGNAINVPFSVVGGGVLVLVGAILGFAWSGEIGLALGAALGGALAFGIAMAIRRMAAAATERRLRREEAELADLKARAKLHPHDPTS